MTREGIWFVTARVSHMTRHPRKNKVAQKSRFWGKSQSGSKSRSGSRFPVEAKRKTLLPDLFFDLLWDFPQSLLLCYFWATSFFRGFRVLWLTRPVTIGCCQRTTGEVYKILLGWFPTGFLLPRARTKSGWQEVDQELDMGCQLLTRTFQCWNYRGLSCSSPPATPNTIFDLTLPQKESGKKSHEKKAQEH